MFLEALKLGILTWESMSPNPLLDPDPSGGRDIAIFLNAEVPSPARPTTPPLGSILWSDTIIRCDTQNCDNKKGLLEMNHTNLNGTHGK